MDFKQLQSFVAVVRHGSFTKAAEQLYTSQPTISTHIRQLEEEFSSRLIIRTTRSIEVTPRGQELYEMASHILNLTDSLTERWARENEDMIFLGTSTIPSAYILPEVLPAFRKICPKIRFQIHQSDSRKIIDDLLCGSFELGMVGMKDDTEGVGFLPFYRDSMVVITPATDSFRRRKKSGEPVASWLQEEPILLREQGSGSRKCIESYFLQAGICEEDLNVTARLNDQESIKSLVAGGLGISIISHKAAASLAEQGRILTFELPEYGAARTLYLAYRKDYIRKPQLQQFMDFVCAFYREKKELSPRQ